MTLKPCMFGRVSASNQFGVIVHQAMPEMGYTPVCVALSGSLHTVGYRPADDDEPITCMNCVTMPWYGEPDEEHFESHGYACHILRGPTYSLCGYVDVPLDHPSGRVASGGIVEGVDDFTLEVHGGITYSSACEEDPTRWRFGFDCGHAHDLNPSMNLSVFRNDASFVYRDFAYVRAEVVKLAEQLRTAEGNPFR